MIGTGACPYLHYGRALSTFSFVPIATLSQLSCGGRMRALRRTAAWAVLGGALVAACVVEAAAVATAHGLAVGATGAGKSTILKLLLRFYDTDSGRITIDGRSIRDGTSSSLRDAFGVVPQDPLLFNASVMENLRYARPGATDEEVFEACRAAAIHDKVLAFASGYDTRVGEQGSKLSGAEVQRLAIARVFLRDPRILVLDEATSAVDTATESDIQLALDVLKRRRTTFLIAHRLSTVVSADQICVVHDGQVVERGTHAELLRLGGRYHDLWSRQPFR